MLFVLIIVIVYFINKEQMCNIFVLLLFIFTSKSEITLSKIRKLKSQPQHPIETDLLYCFKVGRQSYQVFTHYPIIYF